MSQTETMRKVVSETKRVVDGIQPDQLTNATPCSDWDVRGVLNHITGGATMFAICVEDGSISDEELGRLTGTDLLGDDYKAAFGAAADRAVAAFDAPGVDAKTVKLPFGEMPAGVALGIAVFDVTTHALDLAQATGQSKDLDPEVLEAAWTNAQMMLSPELRSTGIFAPQQDIGPEAPLADRLMAFTGRTV
jgi:uncharacterized protein (TIGR03086 family)